MNEFVITVSLVAEFFVLKQQHLVKPQIVTTF